METHIKSQCLKLSRQLPPKSHPVQPGIDRNSSSLPPAWLKNIPTAIDRVGRMKARPWHVWGTAVCLGGEHLPDYSGAVGISLYGFIQPQDS